ncbi:unnamed protein product [Paramecium sonneborni]|uniref:Uncharacterized protein n=1 Tax=Paramecium sonneborni TaxID=65129 RepID=A0A8S1PFS6_9CILI|nr:unnamed protein product [Paramecium sonneborni]
MATMNVIMEELQSICFDKIWKNILEKQNNGKQVKDNKMIEKRQITCLSIAKITVMKMLYINFRNSKIRMCQITVTLGKYAFKSFLIR